MSARLVRDIMTAEPITVTPAALMLGPRKSMRDRPIRTR
jgi:hypothetical protein